MTTGPTHHVKPSSVPSPGAARRQVWLAAGLIVVAGVAAYHNSFGGPFVFDDLLSIVENSTIRNLGSLDVLRPPSGQGLTVEGRPLLNFSFALNYAASGQTVGSYHALNLGIHLAAGLAFFGVVRRTLLRQGAPVPPAARAAALPIALVAALLWLLHPLQTESVTYVVQRAESLMGLFFLVALYGFVRGVDGAETMVGGGRRWFALGVAAAFSGAATKEVTAALPLIVLLYDRTFVAGTFRAAWRERGRVHLALLSCWLLIGALIVGAGNRGGTVGFGSHVAWGTYALTQFGAIAHYVRLTFWPSPLIFDYGTEWAVGVTDVWPSMLLVLALGAGSLLALRRWPAWGFLGGWFFAPLAPTSLIPGNRQAMAEHRMYLPLAALAMTVAIVGFLWLHRRSSAWRTIPAILVVVALATLTMQRNRDYRTELGLFRDTVAKRPNYGFAHYNLGKALAESGAPSDAVGHYEAAIRLRPTLAVAHYNLGNALAELGRTTEAVRAYEEALRLAPGHAGSHYNLGNALVRAGRKPEAKEHFAAAVHLAPDFLDAHANLGGVLLELGELEPARQEFERVLAADPAIASVHMNLGNVHLLAGRRPEATREFSRALELEPNFAAARDALKRLGAAGPTEGKNRSDR
ncbi:MAG: tetratricopeptide repeat protein [Opitutus sp.]|nr:tetratricopeptide repeat protein [Opitutus sp.]